MAVAVFTKAREQLLSAGVNLPSDTIKVCLVDLGTVTQAKAITAATNASPIQITATAHGMSTGHRVSIAGVAGNTNANGVWTVTVVDANNFTLDTSTGNAAYTSGGIMVPLDLLQNLSDIAVGARIATSPALSGKSVTNGVFDATDPTITAVSGASVEAFVVFKDTGTTTTSTLLSFHDTTTGGAAIAFTPNGSDVVVQFDNGVNRIFRLN